MLSKVRGTVTPRDQGPGLVREGVSFSPPNGAKTQLLMHTNTNYLLDLCILLGLFDIGYQLITQKVCILLIKY
jgi:hypothetical protein